MADGPSAAKKAKKGDLPECPYGIKCYRKNPEHLKDFSHTGPGTAARADSSTDKDSNGAAGSVTTATSSSDLPTCKYGAKCYRKNLLHFAEFSHPTTGVTSKADSGSDTDVMSDSDDNDKKNKKKGCASDILSRGMSLVKSYSQMSEDERKELIKKAFEVKLQLEKELKETKQKVDKLQDQVNTGLLLVDGEKEALEGTEMKTFVLTAERDYKEGSAAQIHFRLAESQFYRLLSGMNYRLSKVEYIVNPKLVKNFQQSRADLKKSRGENMSYPVLAFHGTQEANIMKICEAGFKAPGESGFNMRTDTGWYGAGVYFSEYPSYSMSYIQGATKLLLCQVLPGKAFQCTKLIHGAKLQKGYDSHTSPCKQELVIFNSHRIVPSYVVHYTMATGAFKYSSTSTAAGSLPALEACSLPALEAYDKAQMVPASKLFKNMKILFSGKFCTTQGNLQNLIKNHGSAKATLGDFTHIITTLEQIEISSTKLEKATSNGTMKLKEEFLFDSILAKKLMDELDYEIN